jgi:CheY-like chemotaxis protein
MTADQPPRDRPLRVIIADDQASVREGLVLLLGGLPGIDVVGSAADGEQALALVAEQHPDAILLDLHMPVLDGIGATRRLVAEHPGVAIVVLTTYVDDSSVLEALRAGAPRPGHGTGWPPSATPSTTASAETAVRCAISEAGLVFRM